MRDFFSERRTPGRKLSNKGNYFPNSVSAASAIFGAVRPCFT